MTSHAIRKTMPKRQAVQRSIEENHEVQLRTEELRGLQPDVHCDLFELAGRVRKLSPTPIERAHLSKLWYRAGKGVFFDTLLAFQAK